MSTQDFQLLFMALLCTAASLGCVFASRQSQIRLNDTFVTIGGMLFLLTLFICSELFGWVYTVVYGMTAATLLALGLATGKRQSQDSLGNLREGRSLQ
jgi:hypothetical protein